MKLWAQRTRNLVLLGVLLVGVAGIASVVTAPWVEESVSDITRPAETTGIVQEQVAAGKQEVTPFTSVSGSAADAVRTRAEARERWIDVF